MRPDELDEINAFTAGFRHGCDVGRVSAREAETILRAWGRPITDGVVTCFCNGAEDGVRGDRWRYLLCKATRG
jgi:hypothetical protein